MQKNRRAQRKIGAECLTIGFAIYQVIIINKKVKKIKKKLLMTVEKNLKTV